MGQVLSLPIKLLRTTKQYYNGLFYYLWGAGRTKPYSTTYSPLTLWNKQASTNRKEDAVRQQHARIHLYSLASNFYLYNKPHYRKPSYRDDIIDNLRNVAVPGTGIALSTFVTNRITMLGYLLTVYPALSFVSSVHLWVSSKFNTSISKEYETRLLCPDDWFHYWRLNCTVVGLHSLLNNMPTDYTMENKWTFLQVGDAKNVPVSPFLKESTMYVIKHKNEEGGMGIYFYSNAVHGGDWIIQSKINNSAWVQSLLPPNAPLSTFRVITASRCCIDNQPNRSNIQAISCVFRAGRAGAATDHDSILFDVNIENGIIGGGTTNAHWYKLGFYKGIVRGPWRSYDEQRCLHHPDLNETDHPPITGQQIPNFQSILRLVEQSHYEMCPTVPFAGWDVVLSDDNPNLPICLLEVNLSCNFFRGSFDEKNYFDYLDDVLTNLQNLRLHTDMEKKMIL